MTMSYKAYILGKATFSPPNSCHLAEHKTVTVFQTKDFKIKSLLKVKLLDSLKALTPVILVCQPIHVLRILTLSY